MHYYSRRFDLGIFGFARESFPSLASLVGKSSHVQKYFSLSFSSTRQQRQHGICVWLDEPNAFGLAQLKFQSNLRSLRERAYSRDVCHRLLLDPRNIHFHVFHNLVHQPILINLWFFLDLKIRRRHQLNSILESLWIEKYFCPKIAICCPHPH